MATTCDTSLLSVPARSEPGSRRNWPSAAWAGFNVAAFYDDDTAKHGTRVAGRVVAGTPERLAEDIAGGTIDQVWIALPLHAEARVREILTLLREHAVDDPLCSRYFRLSPPQSLADRGRRLAALVVDRDAHDGLCASGQGARGLCARYDHLRVYAAADVADRTLHQAHLGRPGVLPAGTRHLERRAFLHAQVPHDAGECRTGGSGPVWLRRGEMRATPFGSLLRRLSLDELPQLVNVLRGEMSLVGPRPERPEFVEQFRREIPGYMQKHLVKAGITGWAQVNDLRGDSDLARRIQYDLYYIDNWSLWFDLRILALTLWHILKSRNSR